MFSTLPVMINDFSLCDIIIVLIYVLYKKCTCRVPFIIESISRMLPCTNHLILIFKNNIIWSNCNDFKTFKDLKINNKWKGAGRSPANPGFGPLVRFWLGTSKYRVFSFFEKSALSAIFRGNVRLKSKTTQRVQIGRYKKPTL